MMQTAAVVDEEVFERRKLDHQPTYLATRLDCQKRRNNFVENKYSTPGYNRQPGYGASSPEAAPGTVEVWEHDEGVSDRGAILIGSTAII